MAGIPQVPNALAPNGGSPMHTMGQQVMGGLGDFRNALLDWRQGRPQFAYDPNAGTMQAQRQDFQGQMMDWRQQRPDLMSYLGSMFPGRGPVMTPGGGVTGAPLQGNPGQQVGMVPGVPGSMGVNPNPPQQLPPVYQLPTY